MSLTPELQKAYDDSCVPFIQGGGAIKLADTKLHPWRVFLEINSACQLKCPTCTKGNMGEVAGLKYDHQTGLMDMGLMERILDKIKSENPNAIVFMYGNSEPFLHPKLPECIAAVKLRGFNAQLSTNLNHLQRVEETLAAGPDYIIISLSGYTQPWYEKGHDGGDIEKVKDNMRILAGINNGRVNIAVNYHIYKDNQHQVAMMNEYALSLGFGFFTSVARAISMENSIQYCRSKDPDATPFEIQEGRPDWNTALPPIGNTYIETMERLRVPPDQAGQMYEKVPMSPVCPVGAGMFFTFIRHDGKTQLCACTADRRITLTDYLDTSPDQMIEQRTGHSICKQCLKYRLNLYFMIANNSLWSV